MGISIITRLLALVAIVASAIWIAAFAAIKSLDTGNSLACDSPGAGVLATQPAFHADAKDVRESMRDATNPMPLPLSIPIEYRLAGAAERHDSVIE